MSNVATLTLKGTSDLKTIATDLKGVATSAQQAKTPLDGLSKSMVQSSKNATSFGQKLKGFGSQFSSSIASIGTLGGTVLNLSRQYQDLGDSQIAVDRAQLKVSKSTEAVGVAQGKLNALTAKGITSGAAYEQAQLDVKQALEAQSLAQQMLTEKQEDHQRAQENFWVGLVPTVTSAGASVVSVLSEIGGEKGLGGLKTKFAGFKTTLKNAFAGLSGAGGITTELTGIGNAASGSVTGLNGMTTATTGLATSMKSLALSAVPVVVAIAGAMVTMKTFGLLIHEVSSLIKGDTLEAVKSVQGMLDLMGGTTGNPLIDLFNKLSPTSGIGEAIANLSGMKEEAKKLVDQLEKVPPPIKQTTSGLEGLDSTINNTNDMVKQIVGGIGSMVNGANSVPAPVNAASTAISSLGTSATTATPQVEAFGGTFATISSNVGPATTGIAGMNALMNPFNANLLVGKTNTQGYNTELKALVTNASRNVQLQQQMAAAVNKATQSMNKGTVAANKYGSSLNAAYRVSNTGGQAPGTVVTFKNGKPIKNQPHYTTFRNGKPIASGFGMGPPIRPAQHGMHETVSSPTWILAGEAGKERVDIGPGGGGSRNTHITISFQPSEFKQFLRYAISEDQGYQK